MVSRTKYQIDHVTIKKIFGAAGIGEVTDIQPLGAGEYNAVFSAKTSDKEYALKIAPSANIPVMTLESNMMASEVHWYEVMKDQSNISVPEIYFTDFSKRIIPTNYFIMEKLSGQPLDKIELSAAEKEASTATMAKMVAEMHKIKNNQFGYIQNKLYPDWYQAIHAMVTAVLKDGASKGKQSKRGQQLLRYIEQYQSVLVQAECCMVNFDIWAPNIIAKREADTIHYSWIDPERSYWGDPIVDFVCLEFLTPLAEKKVSLAAYNSETDRPIQVTKNETIRYGIALGYLAVIMEVERYYRYTWHHFGWWRNVMASKMLFKHAFEILEKV